MKVSVPIVFAAAAGLVNAAPIIIAYAPKPRPAPDAGAWMQNVRWGHAAVNAEFLPPVTTPSPTGYYRAYEPTPMPYYTYRPVPTGYPLIMTAPNPTMAPTPTGYWSRPNPDPFPGWTSHDERLRFGTVTQDMPRRGGCRMRKMRNKSLQWGNKLRVILGLPPIEQLGTAHHNLHLPFTHCTTAFESNGREHTTCVTEAPNPRHHHHMRPLHRAPPFHVRLTHALSSLGPWEGRAVSFVLGCGLGVLLRMLYVFGVLIVRGVRRRRAERRIALVEDSVIFDVDVKEPVVIEALPEYAEKAEATEAEAPQTNNAH